MWVTGGSCGGSIVVDRLRWIGCGGSVAVDWPMCWLVTVLVP